MIFKKLTIQNFMSIRNMSIDLENQGLVLIKGINRDNPSARSNGAGKSSMIEAFVYAVYGRTLRGIKGDSVINNTAGKNMKIFLDFVDDDGSEYRIARYRKHSVNKNHSLLYRNGKDITPKSENDFNDVVANLLQADYLTFTSSLLYSSESFKFTSATDAEMKATFDTMLGLDVFTRCLEITKTKLKEVDDEVSTSEWKIDTIKSKIDTLEAQIEEAEGERKEYDESIKAKIDELKESIADLEKEYAEKVKAKEALEEQLILANKALEKAESESKSIKKKLTQIDQLKDALRETQGDIKDYKHDIKSAEDSIEDYNKKITRANRDIENYLAKITSYTEARDLLDKEIGQPCPTCGQPMTAESIEPAKAEYDEKIAHQQTNVKESEDEIAGFNEKIADYEAKKETLESEIEELQADVTNYTKLIEKSQNLVDEADEAEEKVSDAKDKVTEVKADIKIAEAAVSTAESQMKKAKDDLTEAQESKNPYDSILARYNKELEQNKTDIQELKDGIQDKLDEKECLNFWAQAYSNQGIKSFILDDITPFLNRRVNKYLKKLASNHIEVKFSTQTQLKSGEMREKFSIDIDNSDGGKEYISNSSGERRRIDLAVNLALSDLVASRSTKRINIAIFDEAFDALDDIGTEHVIEVLQELSEEKSSIFVISHNEHLQSYFSNIITIVKEKGCSRLLGQNETLEEDEEQ